VNEAVNELYLTEENYKKLRESITQYDKFDQIALAQKIEQHQLLEFRRISAYLYKTNKRFDKSMDLSKNDELWQDAMETAADSKSQELAEQLLYFFVAAKQPECVAACLYACYELIRPDVVLEVSWRFGLNDYAMPFMVQTLRQFSDKLVALNSRIEDMEKSQG